MRRLWLALIAILLVAVVLVPNVATAEEADGSRAQNSEIYTFVEELCELNKSKDKDAVRDFLADKFKEALSGVEGVEFGEQIFTFNGLTDSYVNLEAKLTNSGATKQIIVGAHYDSMYEGAGDNACGVAALYLTMQRLAKENLSFNIVFVAFDGEEDGLLGSEYYVNSMSQADIDNTLVMFNIDTIATGDNLYLMCENRPTKLANLILQSVDGLQEKPHAKGTFSNTFDFFGYGYYETVQGSDHTPFRLQGIPIAFFFSGTYSASVWGYSESADTSNEVMNTVSDTFENLVAKHPDFEERITTVSDAVVATVTSNEFLTIDARKQLVNLNFWYTVWWPIIAAVVIGIVAISLAILYYRKLQKNAILGETEIKSQTVFDKPKAEDIFSFKSDDSDDIFTFKK
ncbi:MAG: Zn-dependent exopeptidase M28 [Clostridiales bacterium]|nr:Zn-dependent exopeptidase M28 [Clostridiales bacterium]